MSARLSELFAKAIELTPGERDAYLDKECDDVSVRCQVESLLRAVQETASWNTPHIRAQLDLGLIVPDLDATALASGNTLNESKPFTKDLFFWTALIIGIIYITIILLVGIRIVHYGNTSRWLGWSAAYSQGSWVVSAVDAGGPAIGLLQSGDRIIAINGNGAANRVGDLLMSYVAANTTYALRVLRQSRTHEFRLLLKTRNLPGKQSRSTVYFILGVTFFVMAMFMGVGQPTQQLTRLGFLAGMCVSMRLLSASVNPYRGLGSALDFSLARFLSLENPWHFAVTYDFFYMFLVQGLSPFIWRTIRTFFYLACTIFWITIVCVVFASACGWSGIAYIASEHFWLIRLYRQLFETKLWNALELFFVAATSAIIICGFRKITDPDQRKRAQWIISGVVVGLFPFGFYSLATILVPNLISGTNWLNFGTAVNLFLIVIPASVTYAVLKYHALGINIVIRRGLQYVLARRVFQTLLCLPVLGLLFPILFHPHRSLVEGLRGNPLYVNVLLLIILSIGLRYRNQVRLGLDRRFFHSEYEQERLLFEVIGKIKTVGTIESATRLATDCIEAALHPRSLHVLRKSSATSRMALAYASGPSADFIFFLSHPQASEAFEPENGPVELRSDKQRAGPRTSLLAISVSNHLSVAGIIVLGQKKAEEPYTRTDRRLLGAIADQLAVAYQTIWLQEQIQHEQRIRRDVLSRVEGSGGWLLRECLICGKCFDSNDERCPDDDVELSFSFPISRSVADRYHLEQRIAIGGMGAVYRARDCRLGRTVAVKLLSARLFGEPTAILRFEREARAIARLRHPNIVNIHDFGLIESGSGDVGAFIVMELVEGCSWRSMLKDRGQLPPPVLALMVDQVLAALSSAHQVGVLHRDLKPENVLIVAESMPTPTIKIVDFGLAKILSEHSKADQSKVFITESGVVMGTVGYMAPEQFAGQKVDERADIFSVGVMVYESLTGRVPNLFEPEQILGLGEEPESCQISRVLARCLTLRREDRIDSADKLRAELIPLLRNAQHIQSSQ